MTERSVEIADYVEQVRLALADLSPAVREELLEDLPDHLAEVAAEGDTSLVDRLGPPAAYAAELRTAAGIAAPDGPRRNLDDRIGVAVGAVRTRARALDTKVGPILGYSRASEFLRLLVPAWWVVRGYLAALLIVAITGESIGLLPRLGGSTVAALLLLAVTVLASVWLGRRRERLNRWPRRLVNLATAVLVIFGLAAFVEADRAARWPGTDFQTVNIDQYSHIQDVYVYDSQGRLIEDARLFDQNGQPIRLGGPWCAEARLEIPYDDVNGQARWAYPYCPSRAPFLVTVPTGSPGPQTSVPPSPASPSAPPVTPSPLPPAPTTSAATSGQPSDRSVSPMPS